MDYIGLDAHKKTISDGVKDAATVLAPAASKLRCQVTGRFEGHIIDRWLQR